ncbi:uncharacterized protein EI90DRAFT_1516033 [Cantharellus anzutake]|uniref:uncharacterized protein n=1 Tax=Cantharellus anzutake TaxID=1750568 RepID=UPI0019031118|nr:uncharacterized protein EI90DRAFT_1516033 [Cantharellus anzutake]KAF8328699.1 hypothetical protein EI90DRAFT_1516033 [Cantharellus anzutake]
MKAHPTEASRSENRRKVYKKPRNPKACTWCHQNKRECDRNWESDKKCSQCEGWNSECTPHHPKSRKSKKGVDTTGISYPAIPEVPQAEPHLSIDLASGESPHYGGFEQPPACNVPQNMSMASAIEWANLFFGGVFDQSRFKQRSWLPRDVGDDHEYFGIMLLRVLDLFGEEIGGDKLRKATQAYGEESALPTLATVMATMMLSHQLPSSRHQFGE